jgi:hypothetical protein
MYYVNTQEVVHGTNLQILHFKVFGFLLLEVVEQVLLVELALLYTEVVVVVAVH